MNNLIKRIVMGCFIILSIQNANSQTTTTELKEDINLLKENFESLHHRLDQLEKSIDDILWFNKEAFEELIWWLFILAIVEIIADKSYVEVEAIDKIISCYEIIEKLLEAGGKSEYKLEKLLQVI